MLEFLRLPRVNSEKSITLTSNLALFNLINIYLHQLDQTYTPVKADHLQEHQKH